MKDPSSVNRPVSPSPYSAILSVSDSGFKLSAVNERFSSSTSLKNIYIHKKLSFKIYEKLIFFTVSRIRQNLFRLSTLVLGLVLSLFRILKTKKKKTIDSNQTLFEQIKVALYLFILTRIFRASVTHD